MLLEIISCSCKLFFFLEEVHQEILSEFKTPVGILCRFHPFTGHKGP